MNKRHNDSELVEKKQQMSKYMIITIVLAVIAITLLVINKLDLFSANVITVENLQMEVPSDYILDSENSVESLIWIAPEEVDENCDIEINVEYGNNVEEYIENNILPDEETANISVYNYSNVVKKSINGNDWYVITNQHKTTNDKTNIYVSTYKDGIYVLSLGLGNDAKGICSKAREKVLESLKFTDKD